MTVNNARDVGVARVQWMLGCVWKRKSYMSNELKLGQIITRDAQRDAIHIAVVPLVAGDSLWPGSKVRLKYGAPETALCGDYNEDAIGIVDPFLQSGVKEGQRFWCFLFPGTITGMRHHWNHPAFENIGTIANEHEQWLRHFCDKWNFDFAELIEAGTGTGDWRYVVARGRDLHDKRDLDAGDYELFWQHLEAFVGQSFDESHREGMGWSCTC